MILDYKNWKKRNILVVKMLSTTARLDHSLTVMGIPVIVYDINEDTKIEHKWAKDKETICGIIISGSITDVVLDILPSIPRNIVDNTVPVLGICYGNELLGNFLGTDIVPCGKYGEQSQVEATFFKDLLFDGLDISQNWPVTMHHDLMLDELPKNSKLIASTHLCPVAGFRNDEMDWWGIQFHPEKDWLANIIFKNFYKYCKSKT